MTCNRCADYPNYCNKVPDMGSMFYKISEGRDDMPSFKKKMPEATDIWDVVNYVRSLKK